MFFEQIYREQNRMLAARQAKAKEAKAKEASKAKPPVTKIVGGTGVPVVRQSSADSRAASAAGFGTRTDSGEPTKKRSKWDNRSSGQSSGNAFADFSRFQKK